MKEFTCMDSKQTKVRFSRRPLACRVHTVRWLDRVQVRLLGQARQSSGLLEIISQYRLLRVLQPFASWAFASWASVPSLLLLP